MGSNDPVCIAFAFFEGAVSNCINAAMHAHESEKDKAFFQECLEEKKTARQQLQDAYNASKSATP